MINIEYFMENSVVKDVYPVVFLVFQILCLIFCQLNEYVELYKSEMWKHVSYH